ncbi:MAG TPA: tetratricopeptide repeat-containing protein [Flavitalea sp.]|nr:tetratricopeptide repeat-containing protein [Flavitalea sp.]
MCAKANTSTEPKRCFVVMGFGIKTDYATGRKLDLNKSYRLLIKPVVEEQGLICIRADEIRHSGSIDLPMYRELLKADVVIADLSTANVNAFYELGIRHALRPRTTIVISEDKLTYPFDLNHIKITSYTHLGEGIEYEEVERFRKILGETLQEVLDKEDPDSPVYTYLDQLQPPTLEEQIEEAVENAAEEDNVATVLRPPKKKSRIKENKTLSLLIEQGEEAIKVHEFLKAKALFESALLIGNDPQNPSLHNDPYLIHRLAMATYKSQKPDAVTALKNALELLKQLDLDHTNDPETVTQAGAVEKKLYEIGEGEEHLSNAILFFQRGYYLLNNRYNGINLAYTLNCRANSSLCTTKEEQIADMVYANHTRRRVLDICDRNWNEILQREERETKDGEENALIIKQRSFNNETKFWICVNRAESYFGLGDFESYKKATAEANAIKHDSWMMASFEDQVKKLRALLQSNGHLLNPAWKETGS